MKPTLSTFVLTLLLTAVLGACTQDTGDSAGMGETTEGSAGQPEQPTDQFGDETTDQTPEAQTPTPTTETTRDMPENVEDVEPGRSPATDQSPTTEQSPNTEQSPATEESPTTGN